MGKTSYRAAASNLLPRSIKEGLRPIRNGILGIAGTGKPKRAVQECRAENRPIRIIIGAGNSSYEGWIATDVYVLNVCSPADWSLYFERESIDRILSEHVLEHLSMEQNRVALGLALRYLRPGGCFRIAVPDGNRRDAYYRADVSPPRDGHQVLFDLNSLTLLLREVGFDVKPLEYFDENEVFHAVDWRSEDGHIVRSIRYDRQQDFRRGELLYTSLIVDAIKP